MHKGMRQHRQSNGSIDNQIPAELVGLSLYNSKKAHAINRAIVAQNTRNNLRSVYRTVDKKKPSARSLNPMARQPHLQANLKIQNTTITNTYHSIDERDGETSGQISPMFKPTDSAKNDSEKNVSTLPNQLKRIINDDS